ncbi:hypothetical protein F4677DRAFT_166778 [Hypoxylon crocopeplum]|nr:hypothetical protein F4677DRAFT_166778 [Hypoxylon crocopeplum]
MVDADNSSTIDASILSENGIQTNESAQGQKRLRACITCRNMKIKCVSVPGSKDCETCLRLSRPCQDPGPPKARVKTSHKFTELEKKIDALTNALDAERRRNQQSLKQVMAEAQWSRTPDSNDKDDDVSSPTEGQRRGSQVFIHGGSADTTKRGDVIDEGLMDMLTASLLLEHWNHHMRPLMPVVQFSANEDVHAIRTKKPTLFLTIMTIASTSIRPSLVPNLLTRLNYTLAQDVFIHGGKSLDLLQSLVLFSQYYIQPPDIKAFALPQQVYSAVVMSHDLGLGTMPKPNVNDNSDKAKETYRTLLAVYFGAASSATLLRRHQPMLFTPSHRDCMEALIRANDKQNEDRWLCSLVALQEIFDDASKTLNASYTGADESFDDFRTQHLLGIFRQRVADWKSSPSGDIDPRLKNHAASIVDLYIHQGAVRVYNRQILAWYKSKHDSGQPSPPYTVTHVDALCHCLKMGANVLNIYLSLDDATARSLSNVFLVWNLCAAVCLIKLSHFAVDLSRHRTVGGGSYNYVPPSPSEFLEAMIQKLTTLSLNGYFPQSRPFIVAFKKLKMWFLQKKTVCINNNGTCDEEESNGPVHDLLGTQTPPASPPAIGSRVSTPLQEQTDNRGNLRDEFEQQLERSGPPVLQRMDQQSLDWDPNLHPSSYMRTQTDDLAITNPTYDTFDPGYFDAGLGDLGFDLNDMRDIDNFMMQNEDEGLWSLL